MQYLRGEKNVRKFYIKSGPRGELGQRGTRQPRIGNRGHFRLAMIKDMYFTISLLFSLILQIPTIYMHNAMQVESYKNPHQKCEQSQNFC